MANRYLVAGAGVAGLAAVETLRQIDADAHLTLVGNEPPYARMVLPYFMEGRIEESALYTADATYLAELGVDARWGADAAIAGIDPVARSVRLQGGDALSYDALLIATGSHAAAPPIAGADAEGVLNFWALDDANRFLARPHREVAVVGGGFIAFTILDAILTRADEVHLVEIQEQVLPRMVDAEGAGRIADHLAARGVALHTGTEVQSVAREGERYRLTLSSGVALDVDAVILATGVRPNLDFLEGSGIECDAGILVDGRMRASAEGVFAAGDVAQGPILHQADREVHAIQPTAVDHGRVAAANMAGQDVVYEGSLLMNVVAAGGIEAASFGHWSDGADTTVVSNPSAGVYRKYVWESDRLQGAILVGPTHAMSGQNDVGMIKGLVQTGVRLGPWKTYLTENPLDVRRAFAASGAAKALLGSSLLAGRASVGGGFRFQRLPARRSRSPHHGTLLAGAP